MHCYSPLLTTVSLTIDLEFHCYFGVVLTNNKQGHIKVVRVFRGGAAGRYKLKKGDRILEVNNIVIDAHNHAEALALLKEIARNHGTVTLKVAKAQIRTAAAPATGPPPENKVSVFKKIRNFGETMKRELRKMKSGS